MLFYFKYFKVLTYLKDIKGFYNFYFFFLFFRLLTYLKGIEGDIFLLGEELKKYLLEVTKERGIRLRVHEPHGVIIIKGDCVKLVEKFLIDKGF